MCYAVECSKCGKTSWAGCGKHVPGVYKTLAKENVCLCKGWPDVELPADMAAKIPAEAEGSQAETTKACT